MRRPRKMGCRLIPQNQKLFLSSPKIRKLMQTNIWYLVMLKGDRRQLKITRRSIWRLYELDRACTASRQDISTFRCASCSLSHWISPVTKNNNLSCFILITHYPLSPSLGPHIYSESSENLNLQNNAVIHIAGASSMHIRLISLPSLK